MLYLRNVHLFRVTLCKFTFLQRRTSNFIFIVHMVCKQTSGFKKKKKKLLQKQWTRKLYPFLHKKNVVVKKILLWLSSFDFDKKIKQCDWIYICKDRKWLAERSWNVRYKKEGANLLKTCLWEVLYGMSCNCSSIFFSKIWTRWHTENKMEIIIHKAGWLMIYCFFSKSSRKWSKVKLNFVKVTK
jgi:hypothetical protein